MNNLEIEEALVNEFGVANTMKFSEMVSVMYSMMHEESKRLGLANEHDYDFDRDWWKERAKETFFLNINF